MIELIELLAFHGFVGYKWPTAPGATLYFMTSMIHNPAALPVSTRRTCFVIPAFSSAFHAPQSRLRFRPCLPRNTKRHPHGDAGIQEGSFTGHHLDNISCSRFPHLIDNVEACPGYFVIIRY